MDTAVIPSAWQLLGMCFAALGKESYQATKMSNKTIINVANNNLLNTLKYGDAFTTQMN